jgi:hypothetical protein
MLTRFVTGSWKPNPFAAFLFRMGFGRSRKTRFAS